MDNLLEVGQVVNTYGIKGFVKVVPLVDNNSQFKDFKVLYIESNKKLQELVIEEIKFSKNLVLIKFKEINTMEEAENLKNIYLKAKREDIKLEEGAYFIVDLIGLDVETLDGERLGILEDVLKPGANDVYVVKTADKKEILLPVIPDVIKKVDLKERKIIVKLLDGLI